MSDLPSDSSSQQDPTPTPENGNDDAFSRLEKEMAAMKDALGNLSNQIADAAGDVSAVAQEQAKRGLKHARGHMDSIVSDASDRVGAVASAAQSQAATIGDTLEEAIRERPLSMVALAIGLGFLVGVTWRR
jgi:ElaB/YqjD/DUF883 family membrane-anchored ribosome-binding protein